MFRLLGFFVLFLSFSVSAAEVDNLYYAELRVPQQQGEPSPAQVENGLAQVLIKVTGDRSITGKPEIIEARKNALRYLQQFGYQPVDPAQPEVTGQRLQLTFSPIAINQLLQSIAIKPYGQQRPALLLWLASDKLGNRDYVLPESDLYSAAMKRAELRGLPLVVPLVDLKDQQQLPVSDLWGLFEDSIVEASLRYSAEAVLVGRVANNRGKQHIDWLLIDRGEPTRFSEEGEDSSIVKNAIDQVADQLLIPQVSYNIDFLQPGLAITVSGVKNFAAYNDVITFFDSLAVIKKFKLETVNGDVAELRVELDGSEEQFKHAIELEARLTPTGVIAQPDGSEKYSYHWQG